MKKRYLNCCIGYHWLWWSYRYQIVAHTVVVVVSMNLSSTQPWKWRLRMTLQQLKQTNLVHGLADAVVAFGADTPAASGGVGGTIAVAPKVVVDL